MTNKALNTMLLISVIFFIALLVGFAQSKRVSIAASDVIEPSVMVRGIGQVEKIEF